MPRLQKGRESNSSHEVKARSERSMDENCAAFYRRLRPPQTLRCRKSREERPIERRYRFIISYALEPWTLIHQPSHIYQIVSSEFVLQP